MTIYKQNKFVSFLWIIFFVFLAGFCIYAYLIYRKTGLLISAVGFLIFAFIFGLAVAKVITDVTNIKKKVLGKTTQDSLWSWIYDVTTFRSSGGIFTTVISFARDEKRKPGRLEWVFRRDPTRGTLVVSANLVGYVALLKEIRDKATNARFDETTERIIKDDIRMSSARRNFWVAVIFIFIVLLAYLAVIART